MIVASGANLTVGVLEGPLRFGSDGVLIVARPDNGLAVRSGETALKRDKGSRGGFAGVAGAT